MVLSLFYRYIPSVTTWNDFGAAVERGSDIIQFPTMDRDLERRIDAMISRKLEGPGKTVVDLRRFPIRQSEINRHKHDSQNVNRTDSANRLQTGDDLLEKNKAKPLK